MVYRREKRPSFYFEAKLKVGFKQLCTHTPDKKLAQRIEHMWTELATRHRAWDLLEPVVNDPRKIGDLYDVWSETRGDVEEMRRRAKDVDVEPLVAEWTAIHASQVGKDWTDHALKHVRHFFPEGVARKASDVTKDWLTSTLAAYPGKRNTRRKVHSSVSVFLEYCTTVKGIFAFSPMMHVDRPARELLPPTFYDGVTVERIIDWQPTPERRAYFALVYGTGADVSPAILIEREDIDASQKRVRIKGTKTKTRDRTVRVADWAWKTFWSHASTVLHGRIFPAEWNRWTVSDWHRQTVSEGTKDTHGNIEQEGLKLERRIALRRSRHHYAVRMLAAGVPAELVAEQLGSDKRTILDYYGPFIPSASDWDKWEKVAAKHEKKRREAK